MQGTADVTGFAAGAYQYRNVGRLQGLADAVLAKTHASGRGIAEPAGNLAGCGSGRLLPVADHAQQRVVIAFAGKVPEGHRVNGLALLPQLLFAGAGRNRQKRDRVVVITAVAECALRDRKSTRLNSSHVR